MPVVNPNIQLDKYKVLRRLGLGSHIKSQKSSIVNVWNKVKTIINKDYNLLSPSVSYDFYHIAKIGSSKIYLDNGSVLDGYLLPTFFKDGKDLMISVCTVGYRLDEKIENYSKNGDTLLSFLLDCIGSAVIDDLLDYTLKIATQISEHERLDIIGCISPGKDGFTLHEQPKLLKLAHAEKIGVKLTSCNMMIPKKSLSVVVGIGAKRQSKTSSWDYKKVCRYCNLANKCEYRIKENE